VNRVVLTDITDGTVLREWVETYATVSDDVVMIQSLKEKSAMLDGLLVAAFTLAPGWIVEAFDD
jgi:hypothetical protein